MSERKLSAFERFHHLVNALADVPEDASDEVNLAIMQERDRLLHLLSTVHHSQWRKWADAPQDAPRAAAEETNERK